MCFALQQRALFRHLNFQKWSEHGVFYTFWLGNVLRATTACAFSTSQLPKVVRTWCVLYVLTWKCASRYNGMHFFDINFQKWSEHGVFCTFWLGNVLCATTACTFSTSTSKSGPNMVCFAHCDFEMCFAPQRRAIFISHLASWPSEPTSRPSGDTNHWKNTMFRDFPTFSRTCIFFLLTLSLLWSSLFCSSLLYSSAPPLLFICPYYRKFDF